MSQRIRRHGVCEICVWYTCQQPPEFGYNNHAFVRKPMCSRHMPACSQAVAHLLQYTYTPTHPPQTLQTAGDKTIIIGSEWMPPLLLYSFLLLRAADLFFFFCHALSSWFMTKETIHWLEAIVTAVF